ncbi:MAG: hypothetical protein ACRCYY_12800 [Trueperaceae bacterium]
MVPAGFTLFLLFTSVSAKGISYGQMPMTSSRLYSLRFALYLREAEMT